MFKRHPLIWFFVLAYLFTWLIWGTSILQAQGLLSFHIPSALVFWIGLTLAAYLTAALSGGWPAVRDLLARLIRWRVGALWYAVALLLTPLLALLAILVSALFGAAPQIGALLPAAAIPGQLLFGIFFFTLTEETAWRGFALPRLQGRFNALAAGLILGALWALWHLPLWFIPASFQATLPYTGFFLLTVAQSVLFSWLFNHTHGSVLLAGLFHASADVAIPYFGVLTSGPGLFWIFILLSWAMTLVVILVEGPARLKRGSVPAEAIIPDRPMPQSL